MIVTFLIEVGLAIWALARYKRTLFTRLAVGLFLCLALFQLAEFQVCTTSGMSIAWSRLGFAAITLLPPLSLHAALTIAKKSNWPLLAAAYSTGAVFLLYFLFGTHTMQGSQCLGNYVIFEVAHSLTAWYIIYYYGWVVIGMLASYFLARQTKPRQAKQRQALLAFAAGYTIFLIPTTTANLVNRETVSGIPSIMCGFAVLFALILAYYVLPRIASQHVGAKRR